MTTPYRAGFTPVTEEITAFDLAVTGTIPADLDGRYLRNGPNPLSLDDPQAGHLFLGEGMVHGVRLRDGRAEWYRNRWVRNAETARRLGEEPRPGPVAGGMDFAPNTHVIGLAGRTFATVEAGPLPYELTYELETVGSCDFGGGLPGGFAAHTHLDPRTGELHAIAYTWHWQHVQHLVLDATGKVTQVRDVPMGDVAPMVHDFALTEKYVVIYDLPVVFSMEHAQRGTLLPYAWDEARPARIGLLPRAGGDVRWVEVDPCWVFHTLNAYDDGDEVVVDAVRYPKRFVDARLDQGGLPTLDRWRIDVPSGKASSTLLDGRPQEFPRMDERLTGRAYRYGYTAAGGDLLDVVHADDTGFEDLADEAFDNTLIKHDLLAGTRESRRFSGYVGEPVFVGSGAAEDDGYVMTYVNNPERGAADLVILSAQDFTGTPLATVHLPARIPLGFHGSWVSG